MLSIKKCMASNKDNEITKQKRLLVQVVGSHWKHKPLTNAKYFDTSQGITKKLYLDACMKSVCTTQWYKLISYMHLDKVFYNAPEHYKVICNLTQNSGVFILNKNAKRSKYIEI